MKRTLPKRSNLFLMEMILAILFFSLASAVCMQLFVKARTLSQKTSQQNHAMSIAKSAASVFEAGDGTLDNLLSEYPNSMSDGTELTIYFDENWDLCSSNDSRYRMTIQPDQQEDGLTLADIHVEDSRQTELFEMTASCYQSRKVGE